MRKVRRISASDRGDYFLGTDFSYEDIKLETKVSIDDYTRKTLGEAMIDGHRTFIVEATPVDKKTAKELGYSKVTQWVDAEIWMVRKATFDSLRGKPLKTIYTKEIKQVQGIWSAHQLKVENHKTGHTTKFTFSDIDYQKEISDDLFTERALRRGL
ncbi:MAG: outer membrane lipoprotein-sorting protein [Robiginitomaculum sp.]|nr:outer membrane lipoprotein-sorting protein [Robiginitomaculum sp.]